VSSSLLEQRIRLLPAVHSCAIDGDRVTVLVDPESDRRTVAAAVAYIVEDVGVERRVHVLGGNAPQDVDVLPTSRRRVTAWLALASVVAIVCVAAGVAMLLHGGSDGTRARHPRAEPTARTTLPPATQATTPPTFPPDWQLRQEP
jgi:hypothetical protein